jgi:hypothetical protein
VAVYWAVGLTVDQAAVVIGVGLALLAAIVGGTAVIGRMYRLPWRNQIVLFIANLTFTAGFWMLGAIVALALIGGPIGPED